MRPPVLNRDGCPAWLRFLHVALASAGFVIGALGFSSAAWATPPTFAWQSPQTRVGTLPPSPAPFTTFARIAAGEPLQRYTLTLGAGAIETIGILLPAGAPPVEVTLLAPDGGEFSLPSLPQPRSLWLGGIHLNRMILYPYSADVGGTYGVVIQPGAPGVAEPYAIQGNPTPGMPLFRGRPGLTDILRGPVTWLQSLLWLWG